MPTYDYLCPNGHRFEVLHSVTADGPDRCPVCGATPVRKAFTAPTIHFKGTGWAKKDRSATSRSASRAASSGSEPGADAAAKDASGTAPADKGPAPTGDAPTPAPAKAADRPA
ncbi:MAG TPA: zinc ribbon domain-containing protein, partial [Candidatus Limnocylindrales bacterium]